LARSGGKEICMVSIEVPLEGVMPRETARLSLRQQSLGLLR
jgi:hypothetical protein